MVVVVIWVFIYWLNESDMYIYIVILCPSFCKSSCSVFFIYFFCILHAALSLDSFGGSEQTASLVSLSQSIHLHAQW